MDIVEVFFSLGTIFYSYVSTTPTTNILKQLSPSLSHILHEDDEKFTIVFYLEVEETELNQSNKSSKNTDLK